VNRFLIFVLFIASISPAASAQETEFPKIECPPYAETFLNNQYPSVEAFSAELRTLKTPWRELFEGADERSGSYLLAPYDELKSLETIYSSDETAIIVAVAERFRVSFCAVIFLLTKSHGHVQVADIIRRTGIGYSIMSKAEMLKLKPAKYPHLHICVYNGGRRLGWTSDELFIVVPSNSGGVDFKQTLALRDGLCMTPATPWHSFDQEAEMEEHDGRLRIQLARTWGLNGGDRNQTLAVDFHWNARRKKFESRDVGKIMLHEPDIWSGEGLPNPPREENRNKTKMVRGGGFEPPTPTVSR
jgi:hypothetical protein